MATAEQRTALLAVTCGWCGAAPGEPCVVRESTPLDAEGGQRRPRLRLVTTLDGGAHDSRWRRALDTTAPVVAAAVAERQDRVLPELAVAGDRPW